MADWQPIETAPKDGTIIWAYGTIAGDYGYTPDRKDMVKARWNRDSKRFIVAQPQARHDTGFTATHWMHLPPPPND